MIYIYIRNTWIDIHHISIVRKDIFSSKTGEDSLGELSPKSRHISALFNINPWKNPWKNHGKPIEKHRKTHWQIMENP